MRRIEQYTRGLPGVPAVTIISTRDYRLMRAVVRAADQQYGLMTGRLKGGKEGYMITPELENALDAFNAGGKRK